MAISWFYSGVVDHADEPQQYVVDLMYENCQRTNPPALAVRKMQRMPNHLLGFCLMCAIAPALGETALAQADVIPDFATPEQRFTWLCRDHQSEKYDLNGHGPPIVALRTFDGGCDASDMILVYPDRSWLHGTEISASAPWLRVIDGGSFARFVDDDPVGMQSVEHIKQFFKKPFKQNADLPFDRRLLVSLRSGGQWMDRICDRANPDAQILMLINELPERTRNKFKIWVNEMESKQTIRFGRNITRNSELSKHEVALSPDGSLLTWRSSGDVEGQWKVVAADHQHVRPHDVESRLENAPPFSRLENDMPMAFSNSNRQLALAASNGQYGIYSGPNWIELRRFRQQREGLVWPGYSLLRLRESQLGLIAFDDETLRTSIPHSRMQVIDCKTWKSMGVPSGFPNTCRWYVIDHRDDRSVLWQLDGSLVIWDQKSSRIVGAIEAGVISFSARFSPNGKFVAISTQSKNGWKLLVFDADVGTQLHELNYYNLRFSHGASAVAWTTDSRSVIADSRATSSRERWGVSTHMWSAKSGRHLADLLVARDKTDPADQSPSALALDKPHYVVTSRELVGVGANGVVARWDLTAIEKMLANRR